MSHESPSKPCRKPAKPSREDRPTGCSSQFTADDTTEAEAPEPPCVSPGCDSAGWERPTTAAVVKRPCPAVDRDLRVRSYPPACKLPPTSIPDDWLGLAPLASPETLSESSSLVSCGTSGSVGAAATGLGHQRIMSAILPPRMDPILQSPSRTSQSRGGLHLESVGVAGDLATLSPCVENLPAPIAPYRHSPDIVPVPHVISEGSSDRGSSAAVRGSSPDVTRSTIILERDDRCHHCSKLRADLMHYDADIFSSQIVEYRSSCDSGGAASACQPDIVSTHGDHCTAAVMLRNPDSH